MHSVPIMAIIYRTRFCCLCTGDASSGNCPEIIRRRYSFAGVQLFEQMPSSEALADNTNEYVLNHG